MSQITDKNLKNAKAALRFIKNYVISISETVVDYASAVRDINGNSTYSEEYKAELNEGKRTTSAGKIAASLDLIKARAEELRETTSAIINASDVFEDNALTNALMIINNSKDNITVSLSPSVVGSIARSFRGNFAALNALLLVAPADIAALLVKETLTDDSIKAVTDKIIDHVETCENSAAHNDDLINIFSHVYSINTEVDKLAPLYGETFDGMSTGKLETINAAYQEVIMRKAVGL